jgi:hypothetical protein
MRQSLFTQLEKWCPHSKENFLTEVLACVLRENPRLAAVVLSELAGFTLDDKNLSVESQVSHSLGIVDLSVKDHKSCILIEAKWDAPARSNQLVKYQKILDRDYDHLVNKKLFLLFKYVPSRLLPLVGTGKVYWPQLFSRIMEAATDSRLADNRFLVNQFRTYMEDKRMIAFNGLKQAEQISRAFEQIKPFIQDCRALRDQLVHQADNVRKLKHEEDILSEEVIAGWYFDVTPKVWKKHKGDPSLWCGLYVDYKGAPDDPIESRMYLWAAIYWKYTNDTKGQQILRAMQKNTNEVEEDLEYPNYWSASNYSDSFKKLIENRGPREQVVSLSNELKKMLRKLDTIADKTVLRR